MAITLTTPKTRQAETTVRLVSFTINSVVRYAEARFQIGRLEVGSFVKTSERTLVFQNGPGGSGGGQNARAAGADFSYTQLVDNISEIRDLRQAVEAAVVAFKVFDGTVN